MNEHGAARLNNLLKLRSDSTPRTLDSPASLTLPSPPPPPPPRDHSSRGLGMQRLWLEFLHHPTAWTEVIGRILLMSLLLVCLSIWYLERKLPGGGGRRGRGLRPNKKQQHQNAVATALQSDAVGLRPRLDSERSVPSDPLSQTRPRLRSYSSEYYYTNISPRSGAGSAHFQGAANKAGNTATPVDIAKQAMQQWDVDKLIDDVPLLSRDSSSAALRSDANAALLLRGEIEYHGPTVGTTVYQTWTPPPSWAEAARQLVPRDITNLQRMLRLNLATEPATLSISTSDHVASSFEQKKKSTGSPSKKTSTFTLSVMDFSTHTCPPAEGGVLHLYVKESPRSEWLEQTFESAHDAAQFQMDLLAAQFLGSAIHNMYQVLEMIHSGSSKITTNSAAVNKEFVMHDTEWGEDQDAAYFVHAKGVAWDDVMRCLGVNFPRFRQMLHRMLVAKITSPIVNVAVAANTATAKPSTAEADGNQNTNTSSGLQSDSTFDKRLLLGPVDFFRLFVPVLPLDALPECKSTAGRMEQLLTWRKLVARASVLVQSYARARQVVNQGWDLDRPVPENYWKRRLGYDMPSDDYLRDSSAKDEYYEGLVSRNISGSVRNLGFWDRQSWWNWWKQNSDQTVLSPSQAFTLVGSHVFQMIEGQETALSDKNDPVLIIPSLRRLIEKHADLDFFVATVFMNAYRHILVTVFVRSLPRGVDQKFDRVLDRFVSGDAALRDAKLELMIQYTIKSQGLTFLALLTINAYNMFLRWTEGRRYVPQYAAAKTDRCPMAPVRLSSLGATHHFGGSLKGASGMPNNYVASNLYLDSRENVPMASRILISYLEQKSLGDDIVDLTFKLAGDSDDELPERPLGTARFVHCQPSAYPLSAAFIAPQYQNIQSQLATFGGRATQRNPVSLYLRVFLTDPFHAATDAVARQVSSLKLSLVSPVPPLSPASGQAQVLKTSERASVVASRDPFEKAINELIEILKDVLVPVRMELSTTGTARPNSDSTYGSWTNATSVDVAIRARGDIQQVPVLERVSRSDILRFFIASRCSLKTTAVRLVESTAWRGLTFPIDTRMCRLELHNGQFFQQGVDKSNHPVFYFRNTCLGPWRKNEDALIGAVLHRLEASLQVFEQGRSGTRCTLVVLMGRPYRKTKSRQNYPGESHSHSIMHESSVSLIGQEDHDNGEDLESELDNNSSDEEIEDAATVEDKKKVLSNNPRISPSEHWHTHTNKTVVTRLVDLLLTHYPERLHRALVVTGNGDTSYASTFVGSLFALSSLVKSSKTREKVKFVRRYKDLREYVDKDELVTLAGGSAKLEPKVFEC